jgi:PhnB protein
VTQVSYNPAEGFPRVVPELLYEDVGAAVDWLERVFGYRELLRWTSPEGVVQHADIELEGGIIMIAGAIPEYKRPNIDGHVCDYIVVFVADVDRHFDRARREGATIVSGPDDKPWGLRQYMARDLEGHTWEFTQHIRSVPPADWGAVVR